MEAEANKSYSWTLIDLVLEEYEKHHKSKNKSKQNWVAMCEHAIELYKQSEIYKRRQKKLAENAL